MCSVYVRCDKGVWNCCCGIQFIHSLNLIEFEWNLYLLHFVVKVYICHITWKKKKKEYIYIYIYIYTHIYIHHNSKVFKEDRQVLMSLYFTALCKDYPVQSRKLFTSGEAKCTTILFFCLHVSIANSPSVCQQAHCGYSLFVRWFPCP